MSHALAHLSGEDQCVVLARRRQMQASACEGQPQRSLKATCWVINACCDSCTPTSTADQQYADIFHL